MKYIVKTQVEIKTVGFCGTNGYGGACGERTKN